MAYDDLFSLMQPQEGVRDDDYAHNQIDSEIDNNTLLNLITGYQTASDIPPLSTTGKITPENLSDMWAFLNPPLGEGVEAPGLGQLEWAAGPAAGKAGLLKNILSSIRTGGKNLIRGQASQLIRGQASQAAKPGITRAEEVINRTVAKAKGVSPVGKREDMVEKARRYLIPSSHGSGVRVPGHVYVTSGKGKGTALAKHLEFTPKVFQSEKTLNRTINNIQSKIAKSKNRIRQYTDEGEEMLVGARTGELYLLQQRLDALLDYKRVPTQELKNRLDKFIETGYGSGVAERWGYRGYTEGFGR